MTLYVIAAFYAVIGAVWGQYSHNVNTKHGAPAPVSSFVIGLLWPVTIPLCFFIAWLAVRRIKRVARDLEDQLRAAKAEREERLRGLGSDDMMKRLWGGEIVKHANEAREQFNAGLFKDLGEDQIGPIQMSPGAYSSDGGETWYETPMTEHYLNELREKQDQDFRDEEGL